MLTIGFIVTLSRTPPQTDEGVYIRIVGYRELGLLRAISPPVPFSSFRSLKTNYPTASPQIGRVGHPDLLCPAPGS